MPTSVRCSAAMGLLIVAAHQLTAVIAHVRLATVEALSSWAMLRSQAVSVYSDWHLLGSKTESWSIGVCGNSVLSCVLIDLFQLSPPVNFYIVN